MRMRLLPVGVAALLLGGLAGGAQQSPTQDQPAAQGKALPDKERELADLTKVIEAKEKELEALRRKADALRREVAALRQKAGGGAGVFTSPEQLVAGLPENARP